MKKVLITLFAVLAMTGVSYAGSFGIGVSGSVAHVEASGNEKTDAGTVAGGAANTTNHDASAGAVIGSVFLDYTFDSGWAIGVDFVPGSADVSTKQSRTEIAQGASSGSVTRTAKAEVENFMTTYVEMPMGPSFVKLGFSQIDVNTLENAVSGSGTYGNKTLDGVTYGFGFKGELGSFLTKTSIEHTDFEDFSLSSTTVNTISADVDVTMLKFAIVKQF